MEFGVQFFLAVGPEQKPADRYWCEALALTQSAERLGFANVRTVEHYFLSYGGKCVLIHPSPRRRHGHGAL